MHDEGTRQLRFEDGRLVDAGPDGSQVGGDAAVGTVEPGRRSGFALAVEQGALDVNEALVAVVADHGRTLSFGSREEAEDFAQHLSADGGALRVQAAAPNDERDVAAYLLAAHDPATHEPAAEDGDRWTFDVGANRYGYLGEAILTGPDRPHALRYFVEQDLADDGRTARGDLHVTVEDAAPVAFDGADGPLRWTPDCLVVARDGVDGPVLERYVCEVKTGEASFQRSQSAAMARLAESERVLAIRVDVEALPEQYAVTIREVDPVDAGDHGKAGDHGDNGDAGDHGDNGDAGDQQA